MVCLRFLWSGGISCCQMHATFTAHVKNTAHLEILALPAARHGVSLATAYRGVAKHHLLRADGRTVVCTAGGTACVPRLHTLFF